MAYWPSCFVFCDLPFPNLFLTSFVYDVFFSVIYRIPINIINLLYVNYTANISPRQAFTYYVYTWLL